jgi:hypothetical protein
MAIALLRTPVNPFDLKTVLLAKHAQHVVLIFRSRCLLWQ